MGDEHRFRFKFLGGADSLLGVCDPACVHDAVVGRNGVAVVADVHTGTLACCIAFAFTGPEHAGFLAALLGGIHAVSLDHLADGLVT